MDVVGAPVPVPSVTAVVDVEDVLSVSGTAMDGSSPELHALPANPAITTTIPIRYAFRMAPDATARHGERGWTREHGVWA